MARERGRIVPGSGGATDRWQKGSPCAALLRVRSTGQFFGSERRFRSNVSRSSLEMSCAAPKE